MPYPWLQAIGCLLLVPVAGAQGTGRLEELKRSAISRVETARDGQQFDRAAAKLEEVWDQDQTDSTIAEALAIAYLNGDDRQYNSTLETKARGLMEKTLASGGQASFLVKHSHEHMRLTGRTVTNYCVGKLSLRPGHLIYAGVSGGTGQAHSFDLTPGEVQASEAARQDGMVQIKFRSGGKSETFSLLPRNGNPVDGALMRDLMRKLLGIQ